MIAIDVVSRRSIIEVPCDPFHSGALLIVTYLVYSARFAKLVSQHFDVKTEVVEFFGI